LLAQLVELGVYNWSKAVCVCLCVNQGGANQTATRRDFVIVQGDPDTYPGQPLDIPPKHLPHEIITPVKN